MQKLVSFVLCVIGALSMNTVNAEISAADRDHAAANIQPQVVAWRR